MVLIKEFREKLNISQQELSKLSGISQQAISAIETGMRRNPGIETLYPIAKALQVRVDDLLCEDRKDERGASA